MLRKLRKPRTRLIGSKNRMSNYGSKGLTFIGFKRGMLISPSSTSLLYNASVRIKLENFKILVGIGRMTSLVLGG